MNAFFNSQFNYCPLMCCNRSLSNKINRLHERCLPIVYNDEKSNFEKPLERDGSVSIHHQNITFLAIEMFKVFKGIIPQIVKEIFQFGDVVPKQLRKQTDSQIQSVTQKIKYFSDQKYGRFYFTKQNNLRVLRILKRQ